MSATAASPRRAEAARRNGAKSRGPVTPEGKARASRNATRHGLLAKTFHLLPDEDPAELAALRDELTAAFAPEGAVERHWVEEAVFALWRQKRLRRLSAAVFGAAAAPRPEDLLDDPVVQAQVPPELARGLAAMARYRARIERDLEKALAVLERTRRLRVQGAKADAPAPREADARAGRNEPEPALRPAPARAPEPPDRPPAPAATAAAPPANRQQRRYLERLERRRRGG